MIDNLSQDDLEFIQEGIDPETLQQDTPYHDELVIIEDQSNNPQEDERQVTFESKQANAEKISPQELSKLIDP